MHYLVKPSLDVVVPFLQENAVEQLVDDGVRDIIRALVDEVAFGVTGGVSESGMAIRGQRKRVQVDIPVCQAPEPLEGCLDRQVYKERFPVQGWQHVASRGESVSACSPHSTSSAAGT